MCGIVGALSFASSGLQITEPYIRRMRDRMAHRGPDGAGIWLSPDRRVGLGHRRLAILDLSETASQPMGNEDGRIQIVFNGEIYNHAEVRRELEHRGGHRWRTDHSDTEVIVHAFEEWGIDCLERLRGMFALAIWDNRDRSLWLVRDRIGIKPLYYSVHHGRIVFASEIKALLADPDQERRLHERALFDYLSFLTTPAPQTLFDGIMKLPAGTWLRVDDSGRIRTHRYWDVLDHVTPMDHLDDREIAERLIAELRTSVAIHKAADVPVGVFLSGGIDSSTNAALFSEGDTNPVRTFSIGYDGEYRSYPNELRYARRMADHVGADHAERVLSVDDLLAFLPQMIRHQDEPIADPVCVPVYYVSQLARNHGVTVCHVGEGADELFCGYQGWKVSLQLQRLNAWPVPRAAKRLGLAALRAGGKDQTGYYELLRRGAEGLPLFWGGAEAFTQAQKDRLLSPRLRREFAGLTSWEALRPIRDRFEVTRPEGTPLDWMRYLDLNLRLPELLLMRVDKMSMAVSLEARVPFLDHRFVEFAMGIPEDTVLKHGVLKYILKKAVSGVIPDDLIRRRKQGFGVPIHEWFMGRLGDSARVELERFCRSTDLIDRNAAVELLNRGQGRKAWYLLNLALWWRAYIADDLPSESVEVTQGRSNEWERQPDAAVSI